MCVPIETKDINVKSFSMITNKNEAKTMTNHVSCDFKCNFNSTTCNSNQIWNNDTCQYECKSYCTCKKNYSWNPSTCICESDTYLESMADWMNFIDRVDIVSTKMTNTTTTNVSTNSDGKKAIHKIDFCIMHAVLLVIR